MQNYFLLEVTMMVQVSFQVEQVGVIVFSATALSPASLVGICRSSLHVLGDVLAYHELCLE